MVLLNSQQKDIIAQFYEAFNDYIINKQTINTYVHTDVIDVMCCGMPSNDIIIEPGQVVVIKGNGCVEITINLQEVVQFSTSYNATENSYYFNFDGIEVYFDF